MGSGDQDARAAPGDSQGQPLVPGCPGDPACEECEGTGYVRIDVPVGHPALGKIFLCSCVAEMPGKSK
jgi:hypothetical protein